MGAALHIEFDDETLVVRPTGVLDQELGRVLLRVVATGVAARGHRLRIDLGSARATADAAVAVTGCRRLALLLPDRVTVTG